MLFDFDRIDLWGPALLTEVEDLVPGDLPATIAVAVPKFIEDACDELLKVVDRRAIVARVSAWLEAGSVAAYHGARLNAEEIEAVRKEGLKPVVAASRRDRLCCIFSSHPEWPKVASQLEEVIHRFGQDRDGKVYLTVSRAALMRSFNRYLAYGSDFDRYVGQYLLGSECLPLLAACGTATIFKLLVPGKMAIAACNHFVVPADGPNPVRDILCVWSYWLARPDYRSESYELDCGMIFRETVPPSWIESVIPVGDAEFSPEKLGP